MLPGNLDVLSHSILGTVSDFYQQQALEDTDADKENDDHASLSLPPIFQHKTKKHDVNETLNTDQHSSSMEKALKSPFIPSIYSPLSKKNRYKSNLKDIIKGQKIEKKKENRKLHQLLKGDRIYATREERVLKRWQKQQKEWKSMKKNIAQKIGKKQDELVITRAEEWREMIEEIDLMTKSIPISSMSSNHWQHSLRKKPGNAEITHLVPIGNMFSGLYCKVTHNPQKPMKETVRKPRKLSTISHKHTNGIDNIFNNHITPNHYNLPGKGAASKHWRERSITYQFRKKLHKKMAQLKPNNLDELDGLEIVGRNMFEIEELQLPLYSYERVIKLNNTKCFDKDNTKPQCIHDNDQEQKTSPLDIGPLIDLIPSNVILFNASLYEEQTKVLQIRNTGTTAILLRFETVQQIFINNVKFLYPIEQFSILPGHNKCIAFYFKPSKPGSYHLVIGIESFPSIAQKSIELQGMCIVKDEDKIHRDAFIQQMRNNEIEHDMANMLNNMIQCIPQPDPNMDNLPKSFCQINKDHKLYWYPQILNQLQTLSTLIISKFRRRKRNSYRWDLSVTTLKIWLTELENIHSESVIQELYSQLSDCIERAQIIPPPNPLYYDLCSTLINDFVLQIPRFSWRAYQFANISHQNDMKQQEIANKDTQSNKSITTDSDVFESKLYQDCNEYFYHIIDQFENSVINENQIDESVMKPIKSKLELKPHRIITFGDWVNNQTTSESMNTSQNIMCAEIQSLYNHCIHSIHSNSKITIMTSSYKAWMCSNKQNLTITDENNEEDEKECSSLNDWKILPIFKGFNIAEVFCCNDMVNVLTDTGDVYCSIIDDLTLHQTEVLYNKNIIKITGCQPINKCVALSESGEIFEWSLISELSQDNANNENENEDVPNTDNTETTETAENKKTSEVLSISEAKQWTEIDRKLIDIAITATAYSGITDDGELIIWGDFSTIYASNLEKQDDKKKKKSKKKEEVQDEENAAALSAYTIIEQELVDLKYKSVISCLNSFIVLDNNGNLYSFGNDEHGAMGLGNEINESLQPKQIHFESNSENIVIQCISSWMSGCCAMDCDSNIWYWGRHFISDNDTEMDKTIENETNQEKAEEFVFYQPTKIKIAAQFTSIKKMIVTNIGGFLWC